MDTKSRPQRVNSYKLTALYYGHYGDQVMIVCVWMDFLFLVTKTKTLY